MRRSRALVIFGGLLAALAVATVSARSLAANSGHPRRAAGTAVASQERGPALLPLLATHGPVFGRFIQPGSAPPARANDQACPADMVEVEGDYCPSLEQRCLRWLDPQTKLQCAEFEKAPAAGRCAMSADHKHFCIDQYEWPNRVGALPTAMASWHEAKASCDSIGKRLCSDTEWTLACEGPERRPYPYGNGYARDDSACNIDKPYIGPDPERLFNAKTQADELARLDQREPSGARKACVSSYGVHDMVGNVDEWVVNVSQAGHPFQSGLKGGYWGPVRTRCRPMTTAHDETFRYYQIGFRCCGSVHDMPPALDEAPVATR